eukprot:6074144-Amphidinium_carterae.1
MSSANRSIAVAAGAVIGTVALCHKAAEVGRAFVPSTPQVHPPAASETTVKGDPSAQVLKETIGVGFENHHVRLFQVLKPSAGGAQPAALNYWVPY